jgi:hypothetical protein
MPHEPALVAGITSAPDRARRAGRGGLLQLDGREST